MSHALRSEQDELLDAVAGGTSDDAFAVLGRHETTLGGRRAMVVRTMQPAATRVELVTPHGATAMERRRPEGLFEATIPVDGIETHEFAYHFRIWEGERARDVVDPYQFGQVLTDFDLHLLNEGTHYRAWERLGSHRT